MKGKSAKSPAKHYKILYLKEKPPGYSPHRLLAADGKEVAEVNEFLDAEATRGLSRETLRTYGYELLHFWRWSSQKGKGLSHLKEADLLEYMRFQRGEVSGKGTKVTAKTINNRLTAVRCLYRFHSGQDLPEGKRSSRRGRSHPYQSSVASRCGYLYPARAKASQLRAKEPRKVIMPLTKLEVSTFLESLRTSRDLSIATLMLLCGLRSREVIGLTFEDLFLSEGQIRVRGKGDKERLVPLPSQLTPLLLHYLEVERPETKTKKIFVSLKGKKRGRAMTPAGLRSIFRYHRRVSGVEKANPHRWRHTFGSDMARAGMSLAVLKKLMGHSDIHTTMLYVEIAPEDVREEFLRVLSKIRREKMSSDGKKDET